VRVGVRVAVRVDVLVAAGVGVCVGVDVAAGVGLATGVGLGRGVALAAEVGDAVGRSVGSVAGVDVTVGVGDGSVPVGVIDGVSVMVGVGAPEQVMLRRSVPISKWAISMGSVIFVSPPPFASSIAPFDVHVNGNMLMRPTSVKELLPMLIVQPMFSTPLSWWTISK
jgi:hypothetical protein